MKKSFSIIVSSLLVTLFTLCSYISFTSNQRTNILIPNTTLPIIKVVDDYPQINDSNLKEVTYINEDNTIKLSGLGEADIVFEYIDNIGKNSYKAIFTKNIPKNFDPSLEIKNSDIKFIPKFKFSNNLQPLNKYNLSAKSIFVNFNNSVFSNFIYDGNHYTHFRNTVKDIDKNTNIQVSLSNIIVQLAPNKSTPYNFQTDNGNGDGYIFTKGSGIKIKWNKEDSNPIKFTDDSSNPIFLTPGLTWWIILNEDSSIVYN